MHSAVISMVVVIIAARSTGMQPIYPATEICPISPASSFIMPDIMKNTTPLSEINEIMAVTHANSDTAIYLLMII